MISDEIGLAIMNDCDFNDYVFASPHNVTESCDLAINEANGIVGDYINNYDVILDVCYPSLVEQELRLRKLVLIYLLSFSLFFFYHFHAVVSFHCPMLLLQPFLQATKISVGVDVCMSYERRFYFNLPEVQRALHANRTKLPYSWSMCSG